MEALRLTAAIGLPWLVGAVVVALLCRRDVSTMRAGTMPWICGAGWFVGLMAITLLLRLLSAVGVPFDFAVPASTLLFVAVVGLALLRPCIPVLGAGAREACRVLIGADRSSWSRLAWLALLAWLLVRFAMLGVEVSERPLFAWESWTVWATKAKVFFALGHVVPFADADAWQAAGGRAWFDARPSAMLTVPLLQTWMALAAAKWDDAIVSIPWWVSLVALSMAMFGGLARAAMPRAVALLAVWIAASLPLLDVHVALAGYADLFVAAFYVLGALSLLNAQTDRTFWSALQAILFGAALLLTKQAAVFWAVSLLAGAIVIARPSGGMRAVLAALALAVLAAAVLARTRLPWLPWHLDFAPDLDQALDSAFLLGSWHLLWYGAGAVAILGYRRAIAAATRPLTAVVVTGSAYLAALIAFPASTVWLSDVTTINQAALQMAPVLVVWMFAVYQNWYRHWQIATETTAESVSA